jgi:transcriptional regulator with XRE-family HTH domain
MQQLKSIILEEIMSVGKSIQGVRKGRGFTIKEVAELSGITPSLISQIENDKGNPSLNTLRALAKALNVKVAKFFDEDSAEQKSPLVLATERPLLSSCKGWTNYLLSSKEIEHFSVTYAVLEPNATTEHSPELNPESATGYELGFLIKGRLRVSLEDETYTLNPGDSICFDATRQHTVYNLSDEVSEALWILVPED